jgi:SNF2 family DNA or RNA helicase
MYQSMKKDFLFSLQDNKGDVEAPNMAAKWEALRKICLTPSMFDGEDENGGKIDAVMELVEQAFDAGRKVVIYTWHREFAYILLSRVNRRFKAPGGVVTGGMSFEEQYATANRINTDLQFVVGTIASMSTGLNLQGAQVVIFAETSSDQGRSNQHGCTT